jgi:glycosyltransferase involved in cell wall biosynthesis
MPLPTVHRVAYNLAMAIGGQRAAHIRVESAPLVEPCGECSRPLRVTMVNKYYSPPHLGGVEAVVRWLGEGLAEHAGAQVRALVCNEGPDRVEERVDGVQVVRLARRFRVSSAPIAPALPGALRAEARRFDCPDVLNFHTPYPWGELSLLLARPDLPSVVLYHSDIVRQRRLLTVYGPFLERFLDKVDLIVAASPDLVRSSPFLAPRSHKCRVVPFGLPERKLDATPAILERAAQLRAAHGGRRVVLFVGRFVYYKGADVLVRAMRGVDAELVMIGRGPLEDELHRQAAVAGTRVSFLAPLAEDELAAWYYAADVLCLPSVASSEAFGLVQIEAHAAGTPVVSTALPTGVRFANPDGVTGLVVPPGDDDALRQALARLLEDDDLRRRLGEQARERALREFTLPRMVAGTVEVYREAQEVHIARRSRRAPGARPRAGTSA